MTTSEARKRAAAKYRKEKIRQVNLAFYPKDADLIEFINAQENINKFVKDLIRKEMEERQE